MTIPISGSGNIDPVTTVPVVVTMRSNHLVLRLRGDIDRSNASELRLHLDSVVAACPARRVVIDMAGVDFCDTAAIRAIDAVATAATADGRTCEVRGARVHLGWMFALCGVDHLLR